MELQVRLIIADSLDSAPLSEEESVASADTHHFVTEQLQVKDSRSIIECLGRRSFGDKGQIVVVVFSRATSEAQNALLKCFEEPLPNNRLILIIPHESVLLPTLRSRFTLVEAALSAGDTSTAEEFVALSLSERLDLITKKIKSKDKIWMDKLVVSMGEYIKYDNLKGSARYELSVAVNLAALHIKRNGASVKMLLENIALSLPR